jgi:hypothetical protein
MLKIRLFPLNPAAVRNKWPGLAACGSRNGVFYDARFARDEIGEDPTYVKDNDVTLWHTRVRD